jgi:hypothetical protein
MNFKDHRYRLVRHLATYALVAALYGNRPLVGICIFRRLVGVACPLCGTSRAIAMAVRGRWRASFRMNPLGITLLGSILCYMLCQIFPRSAERIGRVVRCTGCRTRMCTAW